VKFFQSIVSLGLAASIASVAAAAVPDAFADGFDGAGDQTR